MKHSEVEKGMVYEASRGSYRTPWRVQVIEVKRIVTRPAHPDRPWQAEEKAMRVLVQIQEVGSGSLIQTWRADPSEKVGAEIWIEARYLVRKWDDKVKAEQASADATALALLEHDRVLALCQEAGIEQFVHSDPSPWRGHAKVTMNLSQAQVERLAVYILEGTP